MMPKPACVIMVTGQVAFPETTAEPRPYSAVEDSK